MKKKKAVNTFKNARTNSTIFKLETNRATKSLLTYSSKLGGVVDQKTDAVKIPP